MATVKQSPNKFQLVTATAPTNQQQPPKSWNELLELESNKKDDWIYDISDESLGNDQSSKVPSFIRLFVINRILGTYTNYNHKNNDNSMAVIENLVSVHLVGDDTQFKPKVLDVLSRLLTDGNGIKKYMSKWYNEKEETSIIELIFNKIILKEFEKEYNQLMKCQAKNSDIDTISDHDNYYYQNLVFNTNDLMCHIFQFLQWGYNFDDDLFQCSLVNSCWLYHSWNINCVYFIFLDKIIQETVESCYNYNCNKNLNVNSNNNNNIAIRMWQRLIHAKSIYIDFCQFSENDYKQLENKLSLLTNIEIIYADLSCLKTSLAIKIAQLLISRCKTKIINFDLKLPRGKKIKLSPLQLPNAKIITIRDTYFHRIWSNKCVELKLACIDNIEKNWFEFLIKNCDVSNVNNLSLRSITFVDDECMDEIVWKQLICKFVQLKTLSIYFWERFDVKVILFWQLLISVLVANNIQVELVLQDMDIDTLGELNKLTSQYNLKFTIELL